LIRVAPDLLSGAQPEGDAAFAELAARGVRTIVSVDGAEPDTAMAKRHGLRYVHLPIGYDGVPPGRAMELAKLLRESKSPVFVHCHHGKHRAPAAVATAAVIARILERRDAEAAMKLAGTGAGYLGLWRSIREATPAPEKTLAELNVEYCERVAPPPVAATMLKIEERFDALKKKPTAEDALLLKERFAELARLRETSLRPENYRKLLEANRKAVEDLENALRTGKSTTEALKVTAHACDTCHREHRDVIQAGLRASWRGRAHYDKVGNPAGF
jgi:protein tyrosine phosphatase (PTP) superfamily phosphohydrolase (DUF442 family)